MGKRNFSATLAAFLVVIFLTSIVLGQEPTLKDANAYFQAQDWEKTVQASEAITKREPSNGPAWFLLAHAQHNLKKFREAILAYEQCDKLSFSPQVTKYNMACAYSRLGENDKAFEWLDKAIAAGFTNIQFLKSDEDLEALRSDARFAKLIEKADRINRPCEYDERARQFDFWIGEWDVENQQGQRAGTNSIQKIEDGCIILENWTGRLGGTGKSINFFDQHLGKWRQTWVASNGGVSEFVGEYKDGELRFEGESHSPTGQKVIRRLTFTKLDADRVRQFSEFTNDGGKTWAVSYDFIYKRRK